MRKVFTFATLILCIESSLVASSDMSKFLRPIEVPYPQNNVPTLERVELGKLLFFDVRLSKNNDISCATCHNPKAGWQDSMPLAVGDEGAIGSRNTPGILNAAYQHHQFWDGRVKTLEEQALGPIQSNVEMNLSLDEALSRLNSIQGYVELFDKAYPNEGITKDTLAKALASFERTIISSDAPFDKYIKGDKNSITPEALEGWKIFSSDKGKCLNCHDGFNYTDGSFHNIGLNTDDTGRFNVKERDAWFGTFKTPTLRDVTKTAPYFHNGSIYDLFSATDVCAKGGENHNVRNYSTAMHKLNLTKKEIEFLVEFMKALESPDIDIKIPTVFPQ
ncbi:MAG: c-type cytochrome [Arcobacteraceae bacterium]|nr:c-type cytochrome [Arcobacteraceae bacterium]